MGGGVSCASPPHSLLCMHYACSGQSGNASIKDDEKKQRIPNPETTPERGRGWVRIRDVNNPRIHRKKCHHKKESSEFCPWRLTKKVHCSWTLAVVRLLVFLEVEEDKGWYRVPPTSLAGRYAPLLGLDKLKTLPKGANASWVLCIIQQ